MDDYPIVLVTPLELEADGKGARDKNDDVNNPESPVCVTSFTLHILYIIYNLHIH